MITLSLDTASC